MKKLNQKYIKRIVKKALQEDLSPNGDITSNLLNDDLRIKAKLVCNQSATIGGINFAKSSFKQIDNKIIFTNKIKEGSRVAKGKVIAIIKGKAKSIYQAERVALNFLGIISAIATKTNLFVKKVNKKNCHICCTRKTLPGLRLLQKYAVSLGGGLNHRFNLSDEYLIKDNHIACSNIKKIVSLAIKKNKNKKITVEIDNLSQLKKILGLKFNTILFDNMSIKNIKTGLKIIKKNYETEVSGNINLKNVKQMASTGVDRISIGSLTHSFNNVDLKLEV